MSRENDSPLALPSSDVERAASRRTLDALKVAERFGLMFGHGKIEGGKFVWSKGPTLPLRADSKEEGAKTLDDLFFYSSSVIELAPVLSRLTHFIHKRIVQELEFHVSVNGSIFMGDGDNPESVVLTKRGVLLLDCELPQGRVSTSIPEMNVEALVPLLAEVHRITRFNQMGLDLPSEDGLYKVYLSNGKTVEARFSAQNKTWIQDKDGTEEVVGLRLAVDGKTVTNFSRIH